METTLFGGPPEIGNMLKLANGQIGFMTIFAHPLFWNVTDIIPAMRFAADEILTNKGVWFTRAEQEKKRQVLKKDTVLGERGNVSPRTRSPVGPRRREGEGGSGSYFPSSPLKGRSDIAVEDDEPQQATTDGSNIVQSNTPVLKSALPKSSLAQVAAIPTPQPEPTVTATPNGFPSPLQLPSHQETTEAAKDDTHEANHSDTRLDRDVHKAVSSPDGLGEPATEHDLVKTGSQPGQTEEVNDTRRDTAVSMRAGSESLPIMNGGNISTEAETRPVAAHEALSKFSFATSEQGEPVRTFDPDQNHSPEHPENRASAPMANLEHEKQQMEQMNDARQTTSARSVPTTAGTSQQGATAEGNLTPTHSTTATSYTTEWSEQTSPTPKPVDQSAKRDRAISAPLQSPLLKQTYSLNSDQSSTREGSKHNVHATVYANGDVLSEDPTDHNRKTSTRTVGRRRSRMKLKDLAFWKKNRSDKTVNESTEAATG